MTITFNDKVHAPPPPKKKISLTEWEGGGEYTSDNNKMNFGVRYWQGLTSNFLLGGGLDVFWNDGDLIKTVGVVMLQCHYYTVCLL